MITSYDAAAAAFLVVLMYISVFPQALTTQELEVSESLVHSKEIAARILLMAYMMGYIEEIRQDVLLLEDPFDSLAKIASLCPPQHTCQISLRRLNDGVPLRKFGRTSTDLVSTAQAIIVIDSRSYILECRAGLD